MTARNFHEAYCDACDRLICGVRYKCLQCSDIDLCERCELAGLAADVAGHSPDHPVLVLPYPCQAREYDVLLRRALHANVSARCSCGRWAGEWWCLACDGAVCTTCRHPHHPTMRHKPRRVFTSVGPATVSYDETVRAMPDAEQDRFGECVLLKSQGKLQPISPSEKAAGTPIAVTLRDGPTVVSRTTVIIPRATVRDMQVHDLDAVVAIEKSCFSKPYTRTWFKVLMEDAESRAFVACTEEGDVVGYALLEFTKTHVYITSLAVHHEHRRMGYGSQLLQHCLDFTQTLPGSLAITLHAAVGSPAVALYRKHGFVEVEVVKDYYLDYSPPRDAFRMEVHKDSLTIP